MCECGTQKIDRKCPQCDALRKPGQRRRAAAKKAREQVQKATEAPISQREMREAFNRVYPRKLTQHERWDV